MSFNTGQLTFIIVRFSSCKKKASHLQTGYVQFSKHIKPMFTGAGVRGRSAARRLRSHSNLCMQVSCFIDCFSISTTGSTITTRSVLVLFQRCYSNSCYRQDRVWRRTRAWRRARKAILEDGQVGKWRQTVHLYVAFVLSRLCAEAMWRCLDAGWTTSLHW